MEQTGTPELKEFLVIDGQQRITTMYLLLGIIREQIRAKKHLSADAHGYMDELKKYVFNDVGGADDYLKLKVFSSKGDRLPTYSVAFGNDTNPKTPWLQTDLQMYVPGKNGVDAFQKYALKKIKAGFRSAGSLAIGSGAIRAASRWCGFRSTNRRMMPKPSFESLMTRVCRSRQASFCVITYSVQSWTPKKTLKSFITASGLPDPVAGQR